MCRLARICLNQKTVSTEWVGKTFSPVAIGTIEVCKNDLHDVNQQVGRPVKTLSKT